jgi:hypothetical protein
MRKRKNGNGKSSSYTQGKVEERDMKGYSKVGAS